MLAFKMPRIISKSGGAQEEAMLVSTWKVVTVATCPGFASTYQCYQQSNNQLPGPKGRTAWAVPIITARYARLAQVTIKPLSHPHLCVNKRDEGGDRKESLTSANQQQQPGERFLTNQAG